MWEKIGKAIRKGKTFSKGYLTNWNQMANEGLPFLDTLNSDFETDSEAGECNNGLRTRWNDFDRDAHRARLLLLMFKKYINI